MFYKGKMVVPGTRSMLSHCVLLIRLRPDRKYNILHPIQEEQDPVWTRSLEKRGSRGSGSSGGAVGQRKHTIHSNAIQATASEVSLKPRKGSAEALAKTKGCETFPQQCSILQNFHYSLPSFLPGTNSARAVTVAWQRAKNVTKTERRWLQESLQWHLKCRNSLHSTRRGSLISYWDSR